ncbi:hypothetical protein C8R47DRAFT_1077237 [Mycena vitilis]|nr:hypothetical protein C8R47DRAFT_1077237 [Mycena vitilis]
MFSKSSLRLLLLSSQIDSGRASDSGPRAHASEFTAVMSLVPEILDILLASDTGHCKTRHRSQNNPAATLGHSDSVDGATSRSPKKMSARNPSGLRRITRGPFATPRTVSKRSSRPQPIVFVGPNIQINQSSYRGMCQVEPTADVRHDAITLADSLGT